ncbi:biotin--[acetyl-CoA-carboxylase] ligase [Noviherbaspirillum denitrificans]|uniref:biotin--[biotin carboxyl-carrier protein] ligase n=1 Tax=Noviherbaspirillum denitrificans TaxID=1968433 RepID=A0A254TAZ6_9BURK|nr:biotin--[acetyl-CoA-carboxylase] ligase [Noviherbaspirillum denitrificans]OWW19821.1 biotin--[acetyl-CoA-carboxylase] synthetase [Noviherbaspirillum denitrificans]
MTQTLSSERIADLLRPAAQQIDVRVVEETGSTNADLLAALPSLTAPRLLIAKSQTAGRGRAGREWMSAPGRSLTFSLAWKFSLPVHALVGVPLAVGVSIAESLAMFNVPVRLKWPNDVLHEGRKLAGILIESAAAGHVPHDASWAVAGIGINIALSDSMSAEIGRPVANIPWLAELDQDMLMATLASGLAEALVQFEHEGLAAFTARWNALHAYTGQAVVILDNGKVLHEGVAVGVDDIGRFVLDTPAGRKVVMAGDVSLRPKG